MSRTRFWLAGLVRPESNNAIILALVGTNLLFNIVANSSFKVSAFSPNWRGFLAWQVVGNIAGFITVLTLTGLLRFVPLHVGYPITVGLAVFGVQIVGASVIFHEPITPAQWLGTLLIVLGIALIGGRGH
jgi:multidrug transporter EmrE-like cation transporter